MSLYVDLTEFLTNPVTTGIQRVAGELCRYSPPGAFRIIRHQQGRYMLFPPGLVSAIGSYFREPGEAAMRDMQKLGSCENAAPLRIGPSDRVLVPEVIIDPVRLDFFCRMSDEELARHRFIVYDLLPITHPEYFWSTWLLQIFQYFRILRRATNCSFISQQTRSDFYTRLKRTSEQGGVVLPLGCDSLGVKSEETVLNRPLTFSVLGTIEPRKNHELILDAFEPLLEQVEGLTLSFIGRMGWVKPDFAKRMHALYSKPNSSFRFYSAPDDNAIRTLVQQSRATIYVSAAEGYGLPPVESLWLGTPVIASNTIPSLERLGSAGVHLVEPLNKINLRRAVLAFADHSYANRKIEETSQLHLPTWQSFTAEVLSWVSYS